MCAAASSSSPPSRATVRKAISTEYEKAFADLDVGELVELYVEERSQAGDREKLSVLDDAGGHLLHRRRPAADHQPDRRHRHRGQGARALRARRSRRRHFGRRLGDERDDADQGHQPVTHRIGDLHMAPGHGADARRHHRPAFRRARPLRPADRSHRTQPARPRPRPRRGHRSGGRGRRFKVIGSGAVYVVDGTDVSHSQRRRGAAPTAGAVDARRARPRPLRRRLLRSQGPPAQNSTAMNGAMTRPGS